MTSPSECKDCLPPAPLAVGDAVEVWFDGWDTWQPGTVEQVGRLSGQDCLAVLLGGAACASIYPVGRVRRQTATSDLQTTRGPLGGLFAPSPP